VYSLRWVSSPKAARDPREFDGGAITSDGGGLLLREVEKRIGILASLPLASLIIGIPI